MAEDDGALFEPFKESTEWLAPERLWPGLPQDFGNCLEQWVETLLHQLRPHFALCIQIQAKIHKPLGCYDYESHSRTVDAPFQNTTSCRIHLACIMASPKEREEHAVFFGSPIATVQVDSDDATRTVLYGRTVVIEQGETVQQVDLLPRIEGAVLVMVYGLTEEEVKEKQAAQERAEFERNKKVAEDEAKWIKVDDFLAKHKEDLPQQFTREYVSESLSTLNVSRTAKKMVRLRLLGGEDNGRSSVFHPDVHAAEVACVWAERRDGSLAEPGEKVAGKALREFGIRFPISNLEQIGRDIAPSNPNVNVGYYLEKPIQRAVLARIPQLRADPHHESMRHVTQALLQQINISSAGLAGASRKERTCEACGIRWRKTMDRCSRCQAVRYCSRACQIGHWKMHRQACCPVSTTSSKNS